MPITSASLLEIQQQAQDATTGCVRQILVDTAGTNEASVSSGGALKVDGSAATQPISGTVTANAGSGTFATKEIVSSTATLANVAASASSVTIIASNSSRLGAMVMNDSTNILYLKFGATASTSSYTVKLASMAYYELPTLSRYTGIIDGIWDGTNGSARTTELTA